MSNAMSRSKSRWKAVLLATVATAAVAPMAAKAQSMTVNIYANPLGGGATPNDYPGSSNVFIDPYKTDTLYVYATVTGTSAPSASYVDGLSYLYFNVNAASTGTTGLGIISAATPSALFGGGSFNQTSGNTAPSAGAQGGAISTTAYTSTSSIAVGSNTNIGNIAKPRASSDVYTSSPTSTGNTVVVSGNSVSYLVETLSYTPSSATVNANPSTQTAPNSVSFNVSIPSPAISSYGPYTAANYFVGLPSTPSLGASPGASNTSTGYTTSASSIKLTDALPGDVNLDGSVNGGDLAIITSHFNTATTGGFTAGDLNNDGNINGGDLAQVTSHFNQTVGSATVVADPAFLADPTAVAEVEALGITPIAAPVPEPASLGLVTLAAASLLGRRKASKLS